MSLASQDLKWPVIAAVLAALLLAGCGKKGPLYLPQPAPQAEPKPSAP